MGRTKVYLKTYSMSDWIHSPQYWKRTDWTAAAFIFSLLILYPVMNGYPFIYPDSWSYASGLWKADMRSPTLGFAMRPVIFIAGMWGFVVVQTAVTTISLIFLSKYVFGETRKYVIILSIILAGVGFFSGYLMADIWTGMGLIALFSILTGYVSPAIAIFLVFSLSTHYGNFPIFAFTAMLFWLIIKCSRRTLIIVMLCILGSMTLIVSANFTVGAHRFSSDVSYSFIASRILYDIPETIEQKCQDDPSFRLCNFKSDIFAVKREQQQPSDLIWHMWRRDDISRKEFEHLAKELVIYSLPRFPLKHVLSAIKNTFLQLSYFSMADGFPSVGDKTYVIKKFKEHFPDDYTAYKKSWQAHENVYKVLKRLETPLSILYWIAMLVCVFSVTIGWKSLHDNLKLQLALFALIAVVINAFFMSNLSGVLGRFQARIVFLPMFASLGIVSRWIVSVKTRYQAQVNALQNKINYFLGE
jgi:hypothetical protein